MKRTEAVKTGAAQLHITETAIASALRETSMLAVTLLDARREAGLSPVVGSVALGKLGQTTIALYAGHIAIVDVHAALNGVKTRIGCRTVASGGGEKYDEDAMPRAAHERPRLVDAA